MGLLFPLQGGLGRYQASPVLALLDASMHEEARRLEHDTPVADSFLQLFIIQLVDSPDPLLGVLHRERPALGNLLNIRLGERHRRQAVCMVGDGLSWGQMYSGDEAYRRRRMSCPTDLWDGDGDAGSNISSPVRINE